jgi:hypothetical protein
MSNKDIWNGLQALKDDTKAKVNKLARQWQELTANKPDEGTSEFADYNKTRELRTSEYFLFRAQYDFLKDQNKHLAKLMKAEWEKNPNGPAASSGELENQFRIARALADALCALVKNGVALELELKEVFKDLDSPGDKVHKKEQLKKVKADLELFKDAIGKDAAARLRLHEAMVANRPEAVVPAAGGGADGARAGGARGAFVPLAQRPLEEADDAEVSCAELR